MAMAMVLGIGGTNHPNLLQSESSLKFRLHHFFLTKMSYFKIKPCVALNDMGTFLV
jgi:hypothetical protein